MSSRGVRPDPSRSSGEARPGDVARRALWAARRDEAGDSGAPSEGDRSAPPQARPATRGADRPAPETNAARRRTPPQGPRPGDVARAALRAAPGRAAGAASRAEGGAATSPPTGDGAPGAAAAEGTVRSGATAEPSDGGRRDGGRPEAGRSDAGRADGGRSDTGRADGGRSDADRPGSGGASGTPRPGDVAREALRAARTGASQPRTAVGAKGVGRRSRPVGSKPSGSGPSPRTADRGAAAARDAAPSATDPESAPLPTERAFPPSAAPASAIGSGGRGARTGPTGPQTAADVSSSRSTSVPGGGPRPNTTPPSHGSDLRRTFPALPPRPPGRDRFAGTWWGNAWVRALEEAALDPARLARGRVYAGQGHVDAVTVTPGLVLAYVHGSRPRPYRVQIRMRTLADEDWERFLDAAAERPGHIAALLDKDMPQSLAECGVELLPGAGDLEPHCSCPDFGHPCKHAAALCYQTARLLDEDPFVLLLLRGRGERELLDELSRRNAALAARSAHAGQKGQDGREGQEPVLPGVRARDALAPRQLPPLPEPV
ncbi:hypothetical protein G6048_47905, partial [Streptomyces sp. YC419]|nr:hypothetical protein [Streptomyces ureilyticus]